MRQEKNRVTESPLRAARGIIHWVLIAAMCWLAVLLVACESVPGLYVRAAVGVQDNDRTDFYLQTEREWQCKYNVPFNGQLGYELARPPLGADRAGIAYDHRSWWLCGSGLNNEPELYSNSLQLWLQYGGR